MSFWQRHGDEVSAAITVLAALVTARLVDRLVLARGRRLAGRFVGDPSPALETRLRLMRRLLFVTILVIGVALALSQFGSIRRLATGVLASTAVLGLVIGFAARQTLANAVAGVLLAITQPVRIGDYVRFQDQEGVVDDMTLTYTFIDTLDGGRLVVPNEQLVTGVLHNRSLPGPSTELAVSAWVPAAADLAAVRRALDGTGVTEVRVAEMTESAMRIEARQAGEAGRELPRQEGALREGVVGRLAAAGLLEGGG